MVKTYTISFLIGEACQGEGRHQGSHRQLPRGRRRRRRQRGRRHHQHCQDQEQVQVQQCGTERLVNRKVSHIPYCRICPWKQELLIGQELRETLCYSLFIKSLQANRIQAFNPWTIRSGTDYRVQRCFASKEGSLRIMNELMAVFLHSRTQMNFK